MVKAKVDQQLKEIQKQSEEFEREVKTLAHSQADIPVLEQEPQTKLSQKQIDKSKDIYLKPIRTIAAQGQKFNPKFEKEYKFQKEYVQFIAEHKELIGEEIEIWTRPFGGLPAEEWKVPTNKPVWGPRYLAEQIRRCQYIRYKADKNQITSADGQGTYYANIVAETKVARLTAEPIAAKRSIFMNTGT